MSPLEAQPASGLSGHVHLSDREEGQIKRANEGGRQPIVFGDGLWLLNNSWKRWAASFEEEGFASVTPDWSGDSAVVKEANAHPYALAGARIGQVVRHHEEMTYRLRRKPALIGHPFGGALVGMLATRGLSATTLAIDAAADRGRRAAIKHINCLDVSQRHYLTIRRATRITRGPERRCVSLASKETHDDRIAAVQ